MQSIMKPVALVTGADKNVEPELSRQDEQVEHSIQEIVRRAGKTEISATVEVVIFARREPVFDFVTAEDVLPKVHGLWPASGGGAYVGEHRAVGPTGIGSNGASRRWDHSP